MSRGSMAARADLERARLDHGSRWGPIWLLAAIALAAAAWLAWRGLAPRGELIRVRFEDAQGLEAGETVVSMRGVEVGRVQDIELAEDRRSVWVGVRLAQEAKGIAREGSQFRIVRASLGIGEVENLGALLTGPFIEVEPGEGPAETEFDARPRRPALEEVDGSLTIVLFAHERGNIGRGTPVLYRGVQAGEVTDVSLSDDARAVRIRAKFDARHALLVRMDSRFWRAGELEVQLGLMGVRMEADSLRAMISGAIAFATPAAESAPAQNGTAFRLYEEGRDEWRSWFPAIELPKEPTEGGTEPTDDTLGGAAIQPRRRP